MEVNVIILVGGKVVNEGKSAELKRCGVVIEAT